MPLLSPQLLSRLKRFVFLTRKPMPSGLTGRHQSFRRGTSLDFAQLRPYSFGDDWRYLDWKIYARQDKFFVREYEEETNVVAYLIVDASRSLSFGNKLDYSRQLAGAFAYILNKQRDAVGLIVFGKKVEKFLPARQGYNHLALLWKYLEDTTPSGQTDWEQTFSEIVGRLPRKGGVVFLFSDLMGPEQTIIKTLKSLQTRQFEVIVFQILAPAELFWESPGLVQIRDSESQKVLYLESDIKKSYQKVVRKFLDIYHRELTGWGIDYSLVRTDWPVEKVLSDFWQRRR